MEIDVDFLEGFIAPIKDVVDDVLVPVLLAIAFITFLWGVYKYFILGANDEKSLADGRQFVFYGIMGFAIIISVWGLVNLVVETLGFTTGGNMPNPPLL